MFKLVKQMEDLDAKVSQIPQVHIQVSCRLLPTMMALQKIRSGTATQISRITKRCRASESKNLNELHMMGIVFKQRRSRETVFAAKTSADFVSGGPIVNSLSYERMHHLTRMKAELEKLNP